MAALKKMYRCPACGHVAGDEQGFENTHIEQGTSDKDDGYSFWKLECVACHAVNDMPEAVVDRFLQVDAPWSPEFVAVLNDYQNAGEFHPYTCGNHRCRREHPNAVLYATANGWICTKCSYKQNWVMTPPESRQT